MARKLRDIATLVDGWWGPGSRSVPTGAITVVREAIPYLASYPTHVGIAPAADGTLMLEWQADGAECTVELHRGDRMTLTIDEPSDDAYFERTVASRRDTLIDFFLATAPVNAR